MATPIETLTDADFAEGTASLPAAATGRGLAGVPIFWTEADLSAEEVVDRSVAEAIRLDASDLYFLSVLNGVEVSLRVMGMSKVIARLSLELGHRCIGHLRAVTGLNFNERRRPQDGRWIHRGRDGTMIDLRLNTMPTMYGECVAMRVLRREAQLRRLDSLGLMQPQLGDLLSALHSPGGLILVTGPTGSGKTTSMYACLNYLNDGRRLIYTVEDPIEYAIEGLRQSQVDETHGAGFADLIRAVVRQGPDVIMIGEIRDRVTAETAVQAANGGQLVFATVHAPVAAAATQSMLALGVPPHFLASSLLAVISQRLVRTLNPSTRIPVDLSDVPATFADVRPWLDEMEGRTVFAANSGDGDDGYTGRIGVFEVMKLNPELRDLIMESQPTGAMAKCAVKGGMIDLHRAAYIKVAKGITTFDEIQRVLPRPEDFE